MHGQAIHRAALELIAAGANDCEIARRLGVPRTTVRDWRKPRYVRRTSSEICHRCWRPSRPVVLDPVDYAELLGLYLGDGYVGQLARTQRLRIFLDARYERIVAETEALLRRGFPGNRVGRLLAYRGAMAVLWVYHGHLACLFPQHGAGKNHERPIVLEPWQQALVEAAPWAFLSGCIRSDGCVFINRTGKYEYLSYEFCNFSAEIRDLFALTCAQVGVPCRRNGKRILITRREGVRLLVEHVGIKS